MIDTVNFSNHYSYWPLVLIGVFLWVLFVWKEWSPSFKPHFFLRCSIALVSLVSLAMLFLRPTYLTNIKTAKGVLLTKGYEKEQLDSLKKEHKGLKMLNYVENKPIGEVLDSISQLFVIGNGIPSFDFWQVQQIPTKFVSGKAPKGVIKLNYKKELSVGDELVIDVSYNRPSKGNSIQLIDQGGRKIDSALLDTTGLSNFRLSANVKVKGNYSYTLLENDVSGNSITSEPLPIRVFPKENLRILMINSFPTFESKYLKNFLAEAGNSITVRSQLTKGKFKFEYFNTDSRPFYSFSNKQMEPIDLLIIDAKSYANLSEKSLRAIQESVQGDGLGVLILPDARFYTLRAKTTNFEFLRQQSVKTSLVEWPGIIWEKYPYSFKDDSRLEHIHVSNNTIATAYRRNGKGRIGTTVIQNSYQVLLNGNSEIYQKFWEEIITTLGKRHSSTSTIQSAFQFAYKDEPFEFDVRTSQESPQVIGSNGKIPLAQIPDLSELWTGSTYPRNVGWNSIELKNDSTAKLDFYVMDSIHWKSIRTFKMGRENKRKFNSLVDSTVDKKVLAPLNQFWFFLIFVLGMSYLWFTPKLSQN